MTKSSSSTPADAELDAVLALLKEETAVEPSAQSVAAVLAAVPQRRAFSVQPFAALAACAVLGLVVGFGASRFAPNTEDQALDAVIAESFGATYGTVYGPAEGEVGVDG